MKKYFLYVSFSVFFFGTVSAQGLRIGAKFGANLGKIDGASFETSYKLSYHAGGWVEFDLTKTLGIQPELLFSQTTSTVASGTNGVIAGLTPNADLNLNYLTIPILLRYNLNPLITINLGPQYGILLNKSSSLLQNGQTALTSGDFSVLAGAQVNLGKIRAYGRYIIGLTDIHDLSNINTPQSWKSQQLQVGVGLKLL